jgi:hypothetical protein
MFPHDAIDKVRRMSLVLEKSEPPSVKEFRSAVADALEALESTVEQTLADVHSLRE